jgi:signal transduction histidine kinase
MPGRSFAGMNDFLARLQNPSLARRLRIAIPSAGAALYFVLWLVAEAGRFPHGPKELMFLGWAIGIALAGVLPYLALAVTLVIPIGLAALVATFLGTSWSIDLTFSLSTTWPAWIATPVIVGCIAATDRRRSARAAALVIGIVSAVGYSLVLYVAGWLSWRGDGQPGYSPFLLSPSLLEMASALSAGVLIAWVIGLGLAALWRVRAVTTRLETTTAQLDDADLELRLAHDRGRISRDIHDSLAHSLAIIVAQAEGAAAIHALKPEAAPESLANIATVARSALTEVRSLVERINDDEDVSEHTSRLEHIPGLIAELRSTGVDATLRVLGETGPLALSKQVAAFRIVQESLTNALKHGGRGSTVTVTLDAQGAGLAVLVVSKSGGGEPLVNGGGRGIGIAGMKERARLVGGWLTAVPSDDETFVVTAFIPPDAAGAAPGGAPQAEASDHPIDAESQTGALAIEGARD